MRKGASSSGAAATPPSQLETTELTEHFSGACPAEPEGKKAARVLQQRLIERLETEGETSLAEELSKCGQPAKLVCNSCSNRLEIETHCKRRWCPLCARAISAKRKARYAAAVALMQWPLFITLTRPNEEHISQQTFKSIRRAFGLLRHRKLWTSRVKGGIAGIEITNKGKGWHPHLHALVDCEWLAHYTRPPQRGDPKRVIKAKCMAASDELGLAWARCLKLPHVSTQGGGAIFKVKRTTDATILQEVLKYSVKFSDLVECAEPIGDVIRAMQGCRLTTSFGTLHGKALVTDPAPKRECACAQCGDVAWRKPTLIEEIADL